MNRLRAHASTPSFGGAVAVGVAAGLLGAIALYAASWTLGLGMSNDGVLYASAARHLLQGQGLTDFRGDPLVIFPPLLSTTLFWLGSFMPTMETAQPALQASLYVGNLVLSSLLVVRTVRGRLVLPLFVFALLVSRTFLLYHLYLLSEPLFIFLTLGMLLALLSWSAGKRWWLLALAVILCALSCLTRYAGVANVVAGAAIILSAGGRWRKQAPWAALFCITSLLPLGAWLVRNYRVANSLTGSRLPSPYPFTLNLQLLGDSLSKWFLPDEITEWLRLVFVLAGLALLAYSTIRIQRQNPTAARDIVALAIFVCAHLLFLVAATTMFASDYITTRFVMPVYVPLLTLSAAAVVTVASKRPSVRYVVVAAVFGWLAFQSFTSVRLLNDRMANGIGGYATVDWKDSQTMAFVAENGDDIGTDVYSNAPLGIYHWSWQVVNFFPDRLNERWAASYRKEVFRDRPSIEDLASLVNEPARRVALVWFDNVAPDQRYESLYLFNQYTLEDIKTLFRLETILEADDGGVYRVLPR